MECQACTESMSALLDDQLPSSERQSVEEHMASCGECRREYDTLQYSFRLTERLPRIEPSPELWEHIRAEIAPEAVERSRPASPAWRRWLWPALATAAAGMAGLLISPSLFPPQRSPHFEAFLKLREQHYQQSLSEPVAARDFRLEHSNPFVTNVALSNSNPFR